MKIKKLLLLSIAASAMLISSKPLHARDFPKIKISNQKPSLPYAESEAILLLKKEAFASKNLLSGPFKSLLDKTFGTDGYKVHIYGSFSSVHIKTKSHTTSKLLQIFKGAPFNSFVKTATPNYINTVSQKTNDTYYSKLWAVENTAQSVNGTSGKEDADMDTKEAWDIEEGDRSVIVAVLDTGVDYTHEDLKDNMYNGNAKHGYDFAGDNDGNNDDDPMPDQPYDENGHYHGTHVAGIIGAVGNNAKGISGVAQRVSIMALKVFRPNGYGYNSDILEALDYISEKVDEGENIVAVNASYGGGGGSQDDSMNEAIKKLGSQGVIFCAAAGNDGKNIDNDPIYPASYDADNIIAVAATDQDDELASFSNYGEKSVDVAAPGKNILSAYPENKYAYMDGTSMATPNVTGSVALLSAKFPSEGVSDIKNRILNNVDKLSSLSGKVGSDGRVNIYKALLNGTENKDDDDAKEEEPTNNPPNANDDEASVEEGDSVTIEVLKNDSDPDGDPIKVVSVSQPECGSVSYDSESVTFNSKGCDGGETYTFSYTISDDKDAKASASVSVEVEKSSSSGWGFFGGSGNSGGWFW